MPCLWELVGAVFNSILRVAVSLCLFAKRSLFFWTRQSETRSYALRRGLFHSIVRRRRFRRQLPIICRGRFLGPFWTVGSTHIAALVARSFICWSFLTSWRPRGLVGSMCTMPPLLWMGHLVWPLTPRLEPPLKVPVCAWLHLPFPEQLACVPDSPSASQHIGGGVCYSTHRTTSRDFRRSRNVRVSPNLQNLRDSGTFAPKRVAGMVISGGGGSDLGLAISAQPGLISGA